MIENIKKRLNHIENNNLFDAHYINDMKFLIREIEQKDIAMKELQDSFQQVNDDYKALIYIMDRARRLAFLTEEVEEDRPRFKMDANGNLSRIEV